ncbi:MAG: alpha/beta hydrolase [Solirubrobacteraceae bacterium]|nr:alpha/beta hydrolase [Solirubrobacteraceae bacterium]
MAGWLLALLGLVSLGIAANARWPRQTLPALIPSWALAMAAVEFAIHLTAIGLIVVVVLVASGALQSPIGDVGLVLWLAAAAAAIPWGRSSLRTRLDVEGRPAELDLDADDAPSFPRLQIVFPLLAPWRRGVRHERGKVFARVGDDGRELKLDVFRPAKDPGRRLPAIIHIHGGAWYFGSRHEQGLPLLNHLAANGWIGINIDYRLSPKATMPEHIHDCKRAIAWVREHADELGIDASFIAITGGSAGGHLASLCALTPNDPRLQPGFERADTHVDACVSFYGVYDLSDPGERQIPALRRLVEKIVFKTTVAENHDLFKLTSPMEHLRRDAVPFFVIHGDGDTLVPVAESRDFVAALRDASDHVVLYAEMPGGQHAFDMLPTWRSVPVIRAAERFLAATYATRFGTHGETEDAVERHVTA